MLRILVAPGPSFEGGEASATSLCNFYLFAHRSGAWCSRPQKRYATLFPASVALAGTLCGWFGHAWGGAVAAHPLRRCSGSLRRCFGFLWGASWRLALWLNASQPPWVVFCSGAASAHCRFFYPGAFPGAPGSFSATFSPSNSPLNVLFVAVFRQVPSPALRIAGRGGRVLSLPAVGAALDYVANTGFPVLFYSLPSWGSSYRLDYVGPAYICLRGFCLLTRCQVEAFAEQ